MYNKQYNKVREYNIDSLNMQYIKVKSMKFYLAGSQNPVFLLIMQSHLCSFRILSNFFEKSLLILRALQNCNL